MSNFKKLVFLVLVVSMFGFSWPFSSLFSEPNPEQFGTRSWIEKQVHILHSQASNINEHVLKLGLTAYMNARKRGYGNRDLFTVIDYSKPSTEKRLWVFDLKRGKALFNTWVSHGKNSGGITAQSFSNYPGSLKSSLGLFVTDKPYIGGDGYSLRLKGLEKGVNDNAYSRSIVMHGAWYVNSNTIKKYGQIGRSWGCPAVSQELAKPIINTIKENTLLFAYYPNRQWLNQSHFLYT